jgi:hypothetical protein
MAIPANPTITLTPGVNAISLSWPAVSGATGYKVCRSENGGTSYTAALVTTAATSFTDDRRDATSSLISANTFTPVLGLEYNKTYTYKVTAYNGDGESSGSVGSSTPIAATSYSGGTVRGKALAALIAVNTDHVPSLNCTKAQLQTMHDWLRPNLTTKITLFVSKQILFATSGEIFTILNYLKTLVSSYNYDIVTLPHRAWFPTTTAWSAGLTTELNNIQLCHDQCFTAFGKYPVTANAWHYSKDFQNKLISLGYKLSASGFRGQSPSHGDGWGSLGFPYAMYRPSKNNALVPGGGNSSDTFDIVSGFTSLQGGPYRENQEPGLGANGKNNGNGFGNADAFSSMFGQQRTISQVMEDSQVAAFNKFHFLPMYFDPYWTFNDSRFSGTIPTTGETEMWYMQKQIALWMKQRYADLVDFVTAGELADFAYTTIPLNDPYPPHAILSANEQEGWITPDDKSIEYGSQHYSAIVRYKAGSTGYIKPIQEVPFNTSIGEPSFPTNNWNIPGAYTRDNATNARVITFVNSGTTYTLNTGTNLNIHAPTITSDAGARSLVFDWDIYDSTNTTKLLAFRSRFEESGLTNSYTYKAGTVSSVTEQNNVITSTSVLSLDGGSTTTSAPTTTTTTPAPTTTTTPSGTTSTSTTTPSGTTTPDPVKPFRITIDTQVYQFANTSGGPMGIKLTDSTIKINLSGSGPIRIKTSLGVKSLA